MWRSIHPCSQTVPKMVAVAALALVLAPAGHAQITNWTAYNDHRPYTAPPATGPNSWAVTAANASRYDMGAPNDLPASPLKNIVTGDSLPATVTFTRTGGPDDFGTVGRPVRTNTPMGRLFYGICDLANDGIVGVRAVPPNTTESFVTITLGGLDPSKRYIFRGSVSRNGGYGNRWSLAQIVATGWTDAHIPGDGGPGVLTGNNFPTSGLTAGQAAFNSGANNEGAVVGWDDIAPFPDGTFSITCKQYTGAIPGGTANGPYGYSFGAMMLSEVEVVAPTITVQPAALTTVEQNRPFTLSVGATGAPLFYQWSKEGLGELPGETRSTLTVAKAQVSDSGSYSVRVYNSLASRVSTPAQVNVFADTTAPAVESVFSYPNVDAGGLATQDQIIIEFNEPVTAGSVGTPASYTVSGIGSPVSVVVTNDRSVVLTLGTPLADDTTYSVTLSGATDEVGNVAGSSSPSFRSWGSVGGIGLVMESYNVEDPAITVESLLADPDFPTNPFRTDSLRAFDSRLVFPDDSREGYGARISGVFIPPVSGDWAFFARTRNLGLVKLNPNGLDPAGAVEILRQSTENAPFNWDRLSSSLYHLHAGRPYYIEGLYKGATGPDYLKVAARLAGTGVPTPVDTPDTQVDANAITGAAIAYPLAPRDLGGPLTIVRSPADTTVEDKHVATFSVVVNNPSKAPVFYQWYRDGAPVSGSGSTYSFQVSAADDGATFSVQASKVGSTATSGTARLRVVPDTTPPRALSASSPAAAPNNVVVIFDELLNTLNAEDEFNYALNGNNPTSAVLGTDGKTVTLTFAETLVLGQPYSVQVTDGVTDLADIGLSPSPTLLSFVAGVVQGPTLTIARSDATVVISWPAGSTGFTLEQADSIVEPVSAIAWSAVGVPPTVVNGMNTVTLPVSGNKVFRLRQ